MILVSSIHITVLPMVWLLVLCVATIQLLTALFGWLPGSALLAWCVNALGISALYLRKPHPIIRLLQFVVPLAGAAAAASLELRAANPLPVAVAGVTDLAALRWGIIVALTAFLTLPRLWGALREARRPLWGEARLLERAARPGNLLYFTPAGRHYIRERFGTAPEDFIRIVRRRSSPLVTGTPL